MPEKQRAAVQGTVKITITPTRSETGRIRHYWLKADVGGYTYSRRIGYLHNLTKADVIILVGAIEAEIATWLPFEI